MAHQGERDGVAYSVSSQTSILAVYFEGRGGGGLCAPGGGGPWGVPPDGGGLVAFPLALVVDTGRGFAGPLPGPLLGLVHQRQKFHRCLPSLLQHFLGLIILIVESQ